MGMIETFVGLTAYLSPREDDDWSDRLHYLHTPNLLFAFAALISFKQFGGRPMECLFPPKFASSMEQYAENYCWAQDTYYVEPNQHVALLNETERYAKERRLSYYQWMPFFLLLQALFFRVPSFFWRTVSDSSGLRIHEVVEKAREPANIDEESRSKNIVILSRHLKKALRFQNRIERKSVRAHNTFGCLSFTYSPSYITLCYLITKLLYLVNVLGQLWFMNVFLRTDRYEWYGLGVVRDLVDGSKWESSGYFPRVSVCDFEVRQMANIQKYSVQCVLVINLFSEKIFIFLWFWYFLITLSAFVSFLVWATRMSLYCFSRSYISAKLELSNLSFRPNKHSDLVRRFVDDYLRRDGVFVLRMVGSHAGMLFATDLIASLYRAFYGLEEKKESDRESNTTTTGSTLESPPNSPRDDDENSPLRRRDKKNSKGEFTVSFDDAKALLKEKKPRKDDDSQAGSDSEEERKRGGGVKKSDSAGS